MIITDKFIWVHIPRTSGTLMRQFLRSKRERPGNFSHFLEVPWHGSLDAASTMHELFKTPWPEIRFAFVRNPFDWHVSLHHFWVDHYRNKTGAFSRPEAERSPMESWFGGLAASGCNFADWLRAVFAEGMGLGATIRRLCTSRQDKVSLGVTLFRYEDLPGGFWSNLGIPWWDKSFTECWDKGRVNPSPSSPEGDREAWVAGHYGLECLDLVFRGEKGIIERFGYRPPK